MPAGNTASYFAVVFIALYVGHQVGDNWVQTHWQAVTKGQPGPAGRIACARHVASLAATKLLSLAAAAFVLDIRASWGRVALVFLGLAIDAASHYWVDRRTPLGRIAAAARKLSFYRMGVLRPA